MFDFHDSIKQEINESYEERKCVSNDEITEEAASTMADITDKCGLKDVDSYWRLLAVDVETADTIILKFKDLIACGRYPKNVYFLIF